MEERIAVFLPNWIGDVVMATPTLRSLRQHVGPNTHIVGISRPYIQPLLSGSSWLDEMVSYDPKSADKQLRSGSVIRELRLRGVTKVILLTNSLRSAYIAWRSGAWNRIGYARNGRGILLTKALQPYKKRGKLVPVSAVDYYANLLTEIGIVVGSRQPELYTTAIGERSAEHIWTTFRWNPTHRVVGLNTGGAYGAAKHWPDSHSTALAVMLAEAGHRVLVLCGPKEVEVAARIERGANHPNVRSMAQQDLSLEASKACLRRCNLLVTTDSGPRHIAAAFDIPTVTLFGPIDPLWSYNYASSAVDMFDRLECSPCGKRTCPLGHHRCMSDLTPDRVIAAVNQLLRYDRSDYAA